MPVYKLIVLGAAAAVLGSTPARGEEIRVNKWPDDVPCDAVKKNPDGSYTQLKPIMMGSMPMPAKTYKNTPETRAWDQKCAGKPG